MARQGDRLPRAALALVFLTAAALKVEYFFVSGSARLAGSVFESDTAIGIVVVIEIVIAAGLFTRWRVPASYAAMVIAVSGLFVAAWDSGRAPISCSCLGRLHLSAVEHIVLSMCVLGLGGRVVLGSLTTGPTRGDGHSGSDRRAAPLASSSSKRG